jgi:hypothetical protein
LNTSLHALVDLANHTLFHVTEERVVAQTHELTQGRGQEAGLAARLQRTQWQSLVSVAAFITAAVNRIVGRKRITLR